MKWAILIFVLAGGCIASAWHGWSQAALQGHALAHFQGVPAKVVASDSQWVEGTGYAPRIIYEFEFQNQHHIANRYAPLIILGDAAWANQVAAGFSTGSIIQAYVDPQNPANAFITRQARFEPYLFILIPLPVILALAAWLAQSGFVSRRPRPKLNEPGDWYILTPQWTRSGHTAWNLGKMMVWEIYAALVAWHYISLDAPKDMPAQVLLGLIGLTGLWPLVAVMRDGLLQRWLGDLSLAATRHRFVLGQPMIVCVRGRAKRDILIKEISLTLRAVREEGMSRSVVYSTGATPGRTIRLAGGQELRMEYEMGIYRNKPDASTTFSRWAYPRIDWQMEVELVLERGQTIKEVYPLEVAAPIRLVEDGHRDEQALPAHRTA